MPVLCANLPSDRPLGLHQSPGGPCRLKEHLIGILGPGSVSGLRLHGKIHSLGLVIQLLSPELWLEWGDLEPT